MMTLKNMISTLGVAIVLEGLVILHNSCTEDILRELRLEGQVDDAREG
jgi:hypothetical protein